MSLKIRTIANFTNPYVFGKLNIVSQVAHDRDTYTTSKVITIVNSFQIIL